MDKAQSYTNEIQHRYFTEIVEDSEPVVQPHVAKVSSQPTYSNKRLFIAGSSILTVFFITIATTVLTYKTDDSNTSVSFFRPNVVEEPQSTLSPVHEKIEVATDGGALSSTNSSPTPQPTSAPTPTPTTNPHATARPTSSPTPRPSSTPQPTGTPSPEPSPSESPSPTPRVPNPPQMQIVYPAEGEVITRPDSGVICIIDEKVDGDSSGLERKEKFNKSDWDSYENYSELCLEVSIGLNELKTQYRNEFGEESDVYTRIFTVQN